MGALPPYPRGLSLWLPGGYAHRAKKRTANAALPQNRQSARVAPQRCSILSNGEAIIFWHSFVLATRYTVFLSTIWGALQTNLYCGYENDAVYTTRQCLRFDPIQWSTLVDTATVTDKKWKVWKLTTGTEAESRI